MGADAAGAADRRRGQAVPAAVEQGHAGGPARARLQEDQVHQLRLREVRRQRRAAAADRASGRRTSTRCRGERGITLTARPARARRALPAGGCWALVGLCAAALVLPAEPERCWQSLPGVFGGSRHRQRPGAGAARTASPGCGSGWRPAAGAGGRAPAGAGRARRAALLLAGRRLGLAGAAGQRLRHRRQRLGLRVLSDCVRRPAGGPARHRPGRRAGAAGAADAAGRRHRAAGLLPRRPVRRRRGGAVQRAAAAVRRAAGGQGLVGRVLRRGGRASSLRRWPSGWATSASGAWRCLAGGVRCGVAWNTLFLALLTAAGTTVLGTLIALLAERGAPPAGSGR